MLNGRWPHGLSTWNWVRDAIILSLKGLFRDCTTSLINRFAALELIDSPHSRIWLPYWSQSPQSPPRPAPAPVTWQPGAAGLHYTQLLHSHLELQKLNSPSRGLLRDCENFADGSFAALLLPLSFCIKDGTSHTDATHYVCALLTPPSSSLSG